MNVASDASWADQTNEHYWQELAKRRRSCEERQRWLFEHRDREVTHQGRRYVIRLRNLLGDLARLVLGRWLHWSVAILDAGHPLVSLRVVEVRHYGNEDQAIAAADRLAEEVANLGPYRKRQSARS
jgi:hypothetical protein